MSLAHDAPTSFLDLHTTGDGIDVTLTASTIDLAHDLPTIEPDMLLRAARAEQEKVALGAGILAHLTITAEGKALVGELRQLEPLPEKRDLRMSFHFGWDRVPKVVTVQCHLFPYDPRHRTFINFYDRARLERQEIFTNERMTVSYAVGNQQSTALIVRQFLLEGGHHIFIGPDHILFIIGLLLLGGSLMQLFKIVTAFTIAHSITLGLATFHIVSPPAALVEPAIALSIVFVGINAFYGTRRHDPRLLFAFCFGLIHGFGFANALQEMMLPRHALGWSLFAFNAGVEIGQACIVVTIAPVLALLRNRTPIFSERLVTTGALCVVTAGAFWFFQRVCA
jgi:hydrogenase/urease accessory protein HupE